MDDISAVFLAGTGLPLWGFGILCAVSFFGSFLTATLGLGGGMLTLASMALFLPPTALIPVHAVVQLGSNVGRAALMRRHIMRQLLPIFILGTIPGALVGGQMIIALPIFLLKGILACFILYTVWAPKFQAPKPGTGTFFAVAAVSSFVTMFVGATGPLVAPFVNAASENRRQMVATNAIFMTIQHLLKLIVFGLLGFAFGPYVALLVGLVGFGFAGTYIGKHTLNKLPEPAFRAGLKTVLTIIAARLLYSAITTASI